MSKEDEDERSKLDLGRQGSVTGSIPIEEWVRCKPGEMKIEQFKKVPGCSQITPPDIESTN